MNKKLKIVLSACIAVMLVFVAACSGGGKNDPKPSPTANTQTGSSNNDQGTEAAKPDPVTFTYFNAGASRQDVLTSDTEIGKIHAENTGVSWRIEHLVGDVATKIGTMIAGGQYPDVLVPDTEIDKVVEAGAFIDLTDLIEQHGPNIKRVYGPFLNLMKSADGAIYFLPFGAQVGDFVPSPTIDQGAFWVQQRVLKEFNYPKIETLDEYFDLLKQYIAKYPNEKLTAFTALTHDWRFFVLTNPANHLAGYPNDGGVMVDLQSMEATEYGNSEYAKRWLKSLNELNAEGLFDQAAFINNYDQYLANLVSGQVLGFFDYGWQSNQANSSLRQGNDPGLVYFPLPIVFDKGQKDQYLDPPAFVNNRGVGITVSAKDPERIIKFFDYLLQEESQILNQWGIQGLTYEVDENGRFYRTIEQIEQLRDQEYKQKTGLTYFEYYWPMYSQASTLASGNAHSPGRQGEVAQLSFSETDVETLNAYGVKTFAELFDAPEDRPWYPAWSISIEQGSDAQIFTQRKDDLQREYYPKIVLASPDQFESVWNEYVTKFNALDVKVYEDTMTQLIKDKVAAIKGQ